MYIFKHYIGDRYSIIYTSKTFLLASKSRIEVPCVVSSSFDGIEFGPIWSLITSWTLGL